jgi:hypothetical protein
MSRIAAWMLALASTGAIGCDERRAPGGKCGLAEEGQIVACDGSASALVCRSLRLGALPCRGAHGCSGAAPASCDVSLAQEGDACTAPDTHESACSVDRAKTLACRDGHFAAVRACRGPQGCGDFGPTRPGCDQTLGVAGDVCLDHHVHACSEDRKTLLECEEDSRVAPTREGTWGKLVSKSECPTAKGCSRSADGEFAVCDYRGLAAGDRCGTGSGFVRICSPDGAAILACDEASLSFKAVVSCAKGERCITHDPPSMVYPRVACEKPDP